MGQKQLLDAEGGVLKIFDYDEMTDETIINVRQDVHPYLEKNKKLQSEGRHRTADGSMEYVASIPNGITYQWLVDDGVYWPRLPKDEAARYLAKKLNDPEYRYLRTGGGTV